MSVFPSMLLPLSDISLPRALPLKARGKEQKLELGQPAGAATRAPPHSLAAAPEGSAS